MKRLSIRARLALTYGALVLLAGILLLGVTYVLVNNQLPGVSVGTAGSGAGAVQTGGTPFQLSNGNTVTASDLPGYLRRSAMRSMLTQGAIALLAITAIMVAFAWLIAGRALQPIHQITATARRIGRAESGQGLHERIALDGPADEVKQLADTFDAMLERLDRSFDGQRRFVANASHELRTPLAINRALVEVSVTRPGVSTDAQRLGEALLVVNARHERLIDGLLTLADSENVVAERVPVDLAEVVTHVLDQATIPEGVTLRPPAIEPAPTAGDPVLLERLVQNLVENATRHNVPGGWVEVATARTDDGATLTVTNTGPPIARYEVDTLFEPFRRLSGERVTDRGFGLGLSIVRAVTRAHGGRVTATPRDGGGLVLRVQLPCRSS